MPIEIACTCGRELNLRDELAGKTIRCPDCSDMLQVPLPVSEVVDDIAEGPPRQPARASRKREVIDVAPPVRAPERPKEPKKKKKKKSVYDEYYGNEKKGGTTVAFNPGWFGSINSGIVGGFLTLLIGVVMLLSFVLFFFWVRGIIFSIFVICVGLAAILKGLMNLY